MQIAHSHVVAFAIPPTTRTVVTVIVLPVGAHFFTIIFFSVFFKNLVPFFFFLIDRFYNEGFIMQCIRCTGGRFSKHGVLFDALLTRPVFVDELV